MSEGPVIGWQVVDPDGNVVQSGGVSIGKPVGRVAENLDQIKGEDS